MDKAVVTGAIGAAGLSFSVVLAVSGLVAIWLTSERRALTRRLGYFSQPSPALQRTGKEAGVKGGSANAHRLAAPQTAWYAPLQCDERGRMALSSRFVALSALGGAALFGLGGQSLWLAVAGGIAGVILPRLWFARKQKVRRITFDRQIPESLTMMSNSLKAGYSVLQAMDLVGQEMAAPLGPEFRRVIAETKVGVPTEDAMSDLAHRVGSEEMDLVVTAFLIQRQAGGNLAEVLDKVASTIRERLRIRGEVRTLTAQGRLSGVIISLLPVFLGLFMLAVNPAYLLTLARHLAGQAMLAVAASAQVLGILLIRRIIDVEV